MVADGSIDLLQGYIAETEDIDGNDVVYSSARPMKRRCSFTVLLAVATWMLPLTTGRARIAVQALMFRDWY
jgi:hypothetical protein